MSRNGADIGITGVGVVSPAGWGLPAMLECLRSQQPVPTIAHTVPETGHEYLRLPVPKPDKLNAIFRTPRLRRSSAVSRYMCAAAFEALGEHGLAKVRSDNFRLGIVVSCYTGCVNYSERFYKEVLEDPITASPIVFPETVFNAPSSHLSALLESSEMNYTLVGDESQFLSAIELGINWILDEGMDGVLVAAGEENNWLSAEGLSMFREMPVLGEGGCALLLEPCDGGGVRIEAITDRLSYNSLLSRDEVLRSMRAQLPDETKADLLLESMNEEGVWDDFTGQKINVCALMGEGFGVSTAWSCAAAAGFLRAGDIDSAIVSGIGMDQSCAAMVVSK
ncbi:MAG: hypothetical protein MK183_00850 [Verrucomicrobiales bacterium]|nr:hypothetical protein [Verrucomicrobiales bacterium]